ncbi:hypothetical protein QBC38DRAFT_484842 [Podospora fimiseda]|uniref:G-patch domain-containing protein n=1 Tax=Podospora fimiseda TaxID=252190 RepID=A0AAN7BK17_9PEZI|nr:hypothetical protein QBC38DRAFT_484842 [Podospora fimiseda]
MAEPPPPPPPAGGGMSLYANLLESTDNSASISRDPVIFNEAKEDAPAKKLINPALQFQPIRRPQLNKPNRPKPGFPKAPPVVSTPATTSNTASPAPAQPLRSTLADWAAVEDDDYGYAEREKRQRGGRKKKKKKKNEQQLETNWDEIYDPARPTNVEEYLRSEERIQEVREWKAVLYAHRRRRSRDNSYSDEDDVEEDYRPNNQFAPPSSYNFAPPPISPPRPAAATIPNDATGDEAYARRLALSQGLPPPPPPPSDSAAAAAAATISRAPVRYSPPPPPAQKEDDDAMSIISDEEINYSAIPAVPDSSSSLQPPEKARGKAYAQKLMSKYGWTAGKGLGASNSGITSALRVETIKRRKKPDSEGGGYADPKGLGRIIAPKSKSRSGEISDVGKISSVICLTKMLDNMDDLESEIEAGLGQEIGEECGEKYGRVEQVKFDVGDFESGGNGDRRVFIKFVEGVSALRAVNALQGRIFNGNAIEARFFDEEKFERGEYE